MNFRLTALLSGAALALATAMAGAGVASAQQACPPGQLCPPPIPIPQLPQIQRKHQVAGKRVFRIMNRSGKAQHIQGDILVAALNRHHGVGHFHGLGNADVPGAVF